MVLNYNQLNKRHDPEKEKEKTYPDEEATIYALPYSINLAATPSSGPSVTLVSPGNEVLIFSALSAHSIVEFANKVKSSGVVIDADGIAMFGVGVIVLALRLESGSC